MPWDATNGESVFNGAKVHLKFQENVRSHLSLLYPPSSITKAAPFQLRSTCKVAACLRLPPPQLPAV